MRSASPRWPSDWSADLAALRLLRRRSTVAGRDDRDTGGDTPARCVPSVARTANSGPPRRRRHRGCGRRGASEPRGVTRLPASRTLFGTTTDRPDRRSCPRPGRRRRHPPTTPPVGMRTPHLTGGPGGAWPIRPADDPPRASAIRGNDGEAVHRRARIGRILSTATAGNARIRPTAPSRLTRLDLRFASSRRQNTRLRLGRRSNCSTSNSSPGLRTCGAAIRSEILHRGPRHRPARKVRLRRKRGPQCSTQSAHDPERWHSRGGAVSDAFVDRILELDSERRAALTSRRGTEAEKNAISASIAKAADRAAERHGLPRLPH